MARFYFLTIIFLYYLPNVFIPNQSKFGSKLPSVIAEVGNLPFPWHPWLSPKVLTAKSRLAETSAGLQPDLQLEAGSALSSVTWAFTRAGLVNLPGGRRHHLSGQPTPQPGEKLLLQHSLNLSSYHFTPTASRSPATVTCLPPSARPPPSQGPPDATSSSVAPARLPQPLGGLC